MECVQRTSCAEGNFVLTIRQPSIINAYQAKIDAHQTEIEQYGSKPDKYQVQVDAHLAEIASHRLLIDRITVATTVMLSSHRIIHVVAELSYLSGRLNEDEKANATTVKINAETRASEDSGRTKGKAQVRNMQRTTVDGAPQILQEGLEKASQAYEQGSALKSALFPGLRPRSSVARSEANTEWRALG